MSYTIKWRGVLFTINVFIVTLYKYITMQSSFVTTTWCPPIPYFIHKHLTNYFMLSKPQALMSYSYKVAILLIEMYSLISDKELCRSSHFIHQIMLSTENLSLKHFILTYIDSEYCSKTYQIIFNEKQFIVHFLSQTSDG